MILLCDVLVTLLGLNENQIDGAIQANRPHVPTSPTSPERKRSTAREDIDRCGLDDFGYSTVANPVGLIPAVNRDTLYAAAFLDGCDAVIQTSCRWVFLPENRKPVQVSRASIGLVHKRSPNWMETSSSSRGSS